MYRIAMSLLVALAVCGLSANLRAQEGEKVTLTYKAPAPGDSQTIGKSQKMNLSMQLPEEFGGGTQSMEQKEVVQKQIDVLAASGGEITKARVHYKSREAESAMQGMMEDPYEGLIGNTFVIELADAGVTVKNDEGEAVADAVATRIKKHEIDDNGKFKGWGPKLEGVLPAEVKVGEKMTLKDEKVAKMLGADNLDDMDKAEMTLTLREKKMILGTECAVFDVESTLSGSPKADYEAEEGTHIKATPAGVIIVGTKTMWVHKVSIAGDFEMKTQMVNGDGKIEIEALVFYKKLPK